MPGSAFALVTLVAGAGTHLLEDGCVGGLVAEAKPANHQAASIPPGSRHQARRSQVATLQMPQHKHQDGLNQAAPVILLRRPAIGGGAAQAPSSGAQTVPQLAEACQGHHHFLCRSSTPAETSTGAATLEVCG